MIECHDLMKVYNNKNKALDGVSLNIDSQEFLAIVGESGSGKSTFLNILGLIDSKDSGTIIVNDKNYDDLTSKEAACFRNQKIGYIFQNFYLEPQYSVYKNIEVPLLIAGKTKNDREFLIHNTLRKVGLEHKEKQLAKNLSGGEQQRVCIARALVNNPDIILADEPCGNLDSQNTKTILRILKKLNEEGKTVVMVTHSKEDYMISDRCIMFKDGKIIDEKII